MGLEALMYGRPGICDDNRASPINGGPSMLPGWADLSSNSVPINGRPINGLLRKLKPSLINWHRFPADHDGLLSVL